MVHHISYTMLNGHSLIPTTVTKEDNEARFVIVTTEVDKASSGAVAKEEKGPAHECDKVRGQDLVCDCVEGGEHQGRVNNGTWKRDLHSGSPPHTLSLL